MAITGRTRAACEGADPELFFPVGEDGPANEGQIYAAKAYCVICPLRDACLNDALRRGMQYGIWGGKTERERRAISLRENIEVRSKDADHRDRTELVRELASPI